MSLRWEKATANGWSGYSGDLMVASYGKRTEVPGRWWYHMNAVSTRWIAKGHGEVASPAAARRALERAWAKWLAEAGLEPKAVAPAPSTSAPNPDLEAVNGRLA